MSEVEPWQQLVCDALANLALPPDQQVKANGPGCVACDLSESFFHAHSVALQCAPRLSDIQRGSLDRIEAAFRAMEGPDVECGKDEVLRRSAWQKVREMAVEALEAFGWQNVPVRPMVETQLGTWHRPLAQTGPSLAAAFSLAEVREHAESLNRWFGETLAKNPQSADCLGAGPELARELVRLAGQPELARVHAVQFAERVQRELKGFKGSPFSALYHVSRRLVELTDNDPAAPTDRPGE